jgi:geranylgeranyl diphosphate synthase type I
MAQFDDLLNEIETRHTRVTDYLRSERTRLHFRLKHLEDAVYSYINAGGKSLRPAVLMFTCGAVGGDEMTAIPAAATVELYHTFTLVHDDIIDRDETRRGVPTVHHEFYQRGLSDMGFDDATARHYGLAIAILAGDMQQGWAASLLPDLHSEHGLPAALALNLVRELFHNVQTTLINGETTDILQAETPFDRLTEEDVLEMLSQKTGILYEFAGRAGAAIGLQEPDLYHPTVEAIATFTSKCGTAFQIQDDILGILGDPSRTRKPVGSDVREGKRTIIALHSMSRLPEDDCAFVSRIMGNPDATDTDITRVVELFEETGSVAHARQLAERYVEEALTHLDMLDESRYKRLLRDWAHFITARTR